MNERSLKLVKKLENCRSVNSDWEKESEVKFVRRVASTGSGTPRSSKRVVTFVSVEIGGKSYSTSRFGANFDRKDFHEVTKTCFNNSK